MRKYLRSPGIATSDITALYKHELARPLPGCYTRPLHSINTLKLSHRAVSIGLESLESHDTSQNLQR